MANCKTTTAARAFDLYIGAILAPSRETLNTWLYALGIHEEISRKTYTYIQRECDYGCLKWVPINRFNVLIEQRRTSA